MRTIHIPPTPQMSINSKPSPSSFSFVLSKELVHQMDQVCEAHLSTESQKGQVIERVKREVSYHVQGAPCFEWGVRDDFERKWKVVPAQYDSCHMHIHPCLPQLCHHIKTDTAGRRGFFEVIVAFNKTHTPHTHQGLCFRRVDGNGKNEDDFILEACSGRAVVLAKNHGQQWHSEAVKSNKNTSWHTLHIHIMYEAAPSH